MSIYATNFLVNEETGEVKLVKHLNKTKINRCTLAKPPGGWNKSGSKARSSKRSQSDKTRDRRETKVELRKLERLGKKSKERVSGFFNGRHRGWTRASKLDKSYAEVAELVQAPV